MRIVGLDLAGSPRHATGVCVLESGKARVDLLHTDDEILLRIIESKPALVAVDAPLSWPREGLLRDAEKALHRRGIKCFPPLGLASMERLTLRGILLSRVLRKIGINVIEVYSGGAMDVWGVDKTDESLHKVLASMGAARKGKRVQTDRIDAIVCAIVGRMFLQGRAVSLGDQAEGAIVMPKRGVHS